MRVSSVSHCYCDCVFNIFQGVGKGIVCYIFYNRQSISRFVYPVVRTNAEFVFSLSSLQQPNGFVCIPSYQQKQGIQMYNLSFEMMAKMFKGERTPKQLKKKYEKELKEHPDMVHRALRVQITKGKPQIIKDCLRQRNSFSNVLVRLLG